MGKITSRCTECGATSLDGVLRHSESCTASIMAPKSGFGYLPPATELIFSSKKDQKAFMTKLGSSTGGTNLPTEDAVAVTEYDKAQVSTPQPDNTSEELIEKLAAIEHERWADWQRWCHKVLRGNNPSPEQGDILERWDRQIETPYSELSEAEKESDREQVQRYLPLIRTTILSCRPEKLKEWYTAPTGQDYQDRDAHNFNLSIDAAFTAILSKLGGRNDASE